MADRFLRAAVSSAGRLDLTANGWRAAFGHWNVRRKKSRSRKLSFSISCTDLAKHSPKQSGLTSSTGSSSKGRRVFSTRMAASLYLTDRTGVNIVPAFTSKGCPPLVDVPPHILQQAAATPVVLESYLRLAQRCRRRRGPRPGLADCSADLFDRPFGSARAGQPARHRIGPFRQ